MKEVHEYTITSPARLPLDPIKKRRQLEAHAEFITAVYDNVPTSCIQDLSQDRKKSAIIGAMDASNIIFARDKTSEIIGLMAYRHRSQENPKDKKFFDALQLNNHNFTDGLAHINYRDYNQVRKSLNDIQRKWNFFEINEMVIAKPHRENGLSKEMREIAMKEHRSNGWIIMGDFQSASHIAQLAKMGSSIYWAGEIIRTHTDRLPNDLTHDQFKQLASTISAAYILDHYPHVLKPSVNGSSFDKDFILDTGVYDCKAVVPNYNMNPNIMKAIKRIVDRQEKYPQNKFSAIAITMVEPRQKTDPQVIYSIPKQ